MPENDAVLVVGPSWVGDMVMAQSLYKTLKQQSPEVAIDVLAPAWCAPLLVRMPEVRHPIIQPIGHGKLGLLTRFRLGRKLVAERYRQAYIIPRSLKSALVAFFASIPRRTGYRGEMRYGLINDVRPLNKNVLTQTVQRYVALAYPGLNDSAPPIPHPQLLVDQDNARALVTRLKLTTESAIVAIIPGAEYGPAKQWPLGSYADLARQLCQQGVSVWILGSERDDAAAQRIQQLAATDVINLCGKTRLEDAVDLLSLVSAVVTNDSGLMHVAASVNRPLVAIYGSSTPSYTPPLSNRAITLYKNLECSPCFERRCPLGHSNCLTLIGVREVYTAVCEQLKKYKNIELPEWH